MQNDLNKQLILDNINGNTTVKDVCFMEETISTNQLAKSAAENCEDGGMLFVADMQTGGKGRFKRKWVSPKGVGIWATLLLRPRLEMKYATGYSILCAIAIARAIKTVAGLDDRIKWPNDIVIGGKKVCGILTEVGNNKDYIDWLAVGFGINVNIKEADMDEEIKNKATSLLIEKGRPVSRILLLTEVLRQFDELFSNYLTDRDLSPVMEEYAQLSCVLNKQVELIEGQHSKKGIVRGFENDGALILQSEAGLEKINYGEVSLKSEGIYK